MLRLKAPTPAQWTQLVLSQFNEFLQDHASCERKASAMALSMASHYADRPELVRAMIDLAREELEHFHQVYQLMEARGLRLVPDEKDQYVRKLMALARTDHSDHYLLDRLLISGAIEARGCERFAMVAEALAEGELKEFYLEITRSEARHHGLFTRLARHYFGEALTAQRSEVILESEAQIMLANPLTVRMH